MKTKLALITIAALAITGIAAPNLMPPTSPERITVSDAQKAAVLRDLGVTIPAANVKAISIFGNRATIAFKP